MILIIALIVFVFFFAATSGLVSYLKDKREFKASALVCDPVMEPIAVTEVTTTNLPRHKNGSYFCPKCHLVAKQSQIDATGHMSGFGCNK